MSIWNLLKVDQETLDRINKQTARQAKMHDTAKEVFEKKLAEIDGRKGVGRDLKNKINEYLDYSEQVLDEFDVDNGSLKSKGGKRKSKKQRKTKRKTYKNKKSRKSRK